MLIWIGCYCLPSVSACRMWFSSFSMSWRKVAISQFYCMFFGFWICKLGEIGVYLLIINDEMMFLLRVIIGNVLYLGYPFKSIFYSLRIGLGF